MIFLSLNSACVFLVILAGHPLYTDLARVRTLALRVLLREPGRLDELFFDDDLEIIQKFLIRAVGGTERTSPFLST